MPRLALVVTSGMTARWLMRGQPAFFVRNGFEVHLVASPDDDLLAAGAREGVATHGVPMRRALSPLSDVGALVRLVRAFRAIAPDLVVAGTPKAGLLGTLAARLAGVPVRVYVLRGLRLETARGWRRRLLAAAERLAATSAHRVLSVSESLRRRYLELGLAADGHVAVLADGSSNGVDCARFRLAAEGPAVAELRHRLDLPTGAPVVGFVGRLTRDKGVEDLVRCFRDRLAGEHPEARLLLVGAPEAGDPLDAATRAALAGEPRVRVTGWVEDVAPYYGLMQVVAFPSYREGFPNVPLEAAAAGRPIAGYAATGTVDAVADGVTGALVPVGDRDALARALAAYLADPELRRRHGEAGRRRAEERFDREIVWEAWLQEYRRLLAAAGR